MIRTLLIATLLVLSCADETALQDGGPDAAPDARADAGPLDAEPVDADPLDAEPADANPMDADPIDASSADAEPADAGEDASTDAGRDCAGIEAEYQALVSQTSCQEAMECKVLNGHCAVGLGGCWYTVNDTVLQTDLDALADEYTMLGCTSSVCRCTAPPASAVCDQNVCAPPP